jgi:hypothetical protein
MSRVLPAFVTAVAVSWPARAGHDTDGVGGNNFVA